MDNKYKKIYRHLFFVYTITIILAILLLNAYFLKYSIDTKKRTEIYINQQLVSEINAKIENNNHITSLIADYIYSYRNNTLDLLEFIDKDFNKYKEQKLDKIAQNPGIGYFGTEVLMQRTFSSYGNILNISTVSKNRNEARIFNRNTQIDFKEINNYKEISKKTIIEGKNTITHVLKLHDITNLQEKGLLCITYSLNDVKNIIKKYDNNYDVFIFGKDQMIYKSSDAFDQNFTGEMLNIAKSKRLLEKRNGKYYNFSYVGEEVTIVGRVANAIKTWLPVKFYIVLIFVNLIIFAIAEMFIYLKVKKLNARMENIITCMEAVEKGNLDAVIKVDNHEIDELNYISKRFNNMCKELKKHINKSYIAEINQKNAEMKQLQSQINPHFLYNTLEVIRMKAVCSGNKDVGKMLRNLAVLFRSQLKEKDVITIEKELDYSRKYLDLFKLRYDDKFSYEINCDQEVLDCNIIKFILQPILENYIVHGVRLSDDDNKITINVINELNNINIIIRDNGVGISTEKLDEIEKKLKNRNHKSDSIGITNVNQRIKNTYGEFYELEFYSKEYEGTLVKIKIPKTKGE